jgi:anti-sigma factor ChrR (cupin superfamily)
MHMADCTFIQKQSVGNCSICGAALGVGEAEATEVGGFDHVKAEKESKIAAASRRDGPLARHNLIEQTQLPQYLAEVLEGSGLGIKGIGGISTPNCVL